MLTRHMPRTFIDPRDEAPALRRAAVLLERVRQDGGARDDGFEELGDSGALLVVHDR